MWLGRVGWGVWVVVLRSFLQWTTWPWWGEEFLCPELTGQIETGIKEHPPQAHLVPSLSLCDLTESDRIPLAPDAKAGQTLITVSP